jgi:hypothetical protein
MYVRDFRLNYTQLMKKSFLQISGAKSRGLNFYPVIWYNFMYYL